MSKQEFTNKNQEAVAKIVESLIENSGLTKAEFAKAIRVSLATLTNIFRAGCNKTPSIEVIRKISEQSNNPSETYNQIMKAADYDITKYPYEGKRDLITESLPAFDSTCEKLIAFELFNKLIPRGKIYPQKKVNDIRFDLTIDFTDEILIKEWDFFFYKAIDTSQSIIKDFFYHIMMDGAQKDSKYSLVTDSNAVIEDLKKISIPNLDIYISAFLIKNEQIISETYVNTSMDIHELEFQLYN